MTCVPAVGSMALVIWSKNPSGRVNTAGIIITGIVMTALPMDQKTREETAAEEAWVRQHLQMDHGPFGCLILSSNA